MSRSGPYALLLLAALSFLVSTRPDGWGGALVAVGVEVDGAWLRAAAASRCWAAPSGPLGLLWLVGSSELPRGGGRTRSRWRGGPALGGVAGVLLGACRAPWRWRASAT